MRRLYIFSTAAIALSAFAASPASAESLTVQGVVAPYCNVNLTNVSSGTASIAFLDTQKVANLRLSCNSGTGTKMVTNPKNGDLLSAQNNRINYAMKVVSPVAAFEITETDTAPGDSESQGLFTRSNGTYSQQLASGIALELWMNVNVQNEPQPDFAVANQYPANAAPAGTYEEVFTFTASAV